MLKCQKRFFRPANCMPSTQLLIKIYNKQDLLLVGFNLTQALFAKGETFKTAVKSKAQSTMFQRENYKL